jgi:hypothetical protein
MTLILSRSIVACAVAALIMLPAVRAQAPAPAGAAPAPASSAVFKKEEIEQLVAPIALYPDALVAQILMASTYPLEVVEAARWQKANPGLKDKALEDALQKQTWDASVKSLTAFPQVLSSMNEKLDVTQKLGDAFLAQQKEVLDAVQRLRGRADQAGNLKSSKEQTVSKAQEGGTTVIKIEPTNPQTVYVPTYSPAVYGTWPYPAYPPYYYPYPPGAGLFAFTAGVIVGSALWGGCAWGRGDVTINHNVQNNFTRNSSGQGGSGNWQHNPENRKGAGYRDSASQQKYGGGQRAGVDSREQFRGRAEQGRQEINRGGADGFKGGGPSAGTSDRGGIGGGDRGGPSAGTSDRGGGGIGGGDRGGPSAGTSDRGGGGFSGSDRGGGGSFGGGDRGGSAFSGAGGGGASARDQSSRGASSRSSMGGGGGGARAGGGGGGGRGGGGGGRGGRR